MLLLLQFGNVDLYVRILHNRDAERHSTVTYSPAELSRYRALLTAAVTASFSVLHVTMISDVM